MKPILLLFLLAGFGVLAWAQPADTSGGGDKKTAIFDYLDTLEGQSDILPPRIKPAYRKDSATLARYYESLSRYFDYRISGYAHRERVFAWQLFSSQIIFFCVLFLLLVGIFFSYLQFRSSMRADGGEGLQTDLEASTQGFKVSSPVLGVIILVISLLFFYLYLVYIYPIHEVF